MRLIPMYKRAISAFSFLAVSVLSIGEAQSAEAKPGVQIKISKETTYITEPLRKDGYPDYVAALNQRFGEGVTPENNAAVQYWKAMGPAEIQKEYREQYFQMLGIPPLPEKGDYFMDVYSFVARHKADAKSADNESATEATDDTCNQLSQAAKRPWSKREFPAFAEWLASNEKPLALLLEASKRPRRFDPLVCVGKAPLSFVLLPAIYRYKDIAPALAARAMLRLNDGKLDEAWEDLLACHRLARLAGQGPMIIDALVAAGPEYSACAADQALLRTGHLSATRIAKMRDELNRLPPMPGYADRIDVAERFRYLNDVIYSARSAPASAASRAAARVGMEKAGADKMEIAAMNLVLDAAGDPSIDWNIALQMGNSWYDRLVGVMKKPTHAGRKQALEEADQELHRLLKAVSEGKLPEQWLSKDPRESRSRLIGAVCLALLTSEGLLLANSEDCSTMQFELTELAFALAAYRADHGAYPAKLAELVPKYVKTLPKDIFNNDADLHYSLRDKGYLLYSVGQNGIDDGGKGYDDRKANEGWDDIHVRIPAEP